MHDNSEGFNSCLDSPLVPRDQDIDMENFYINRNHTWSEDPGEDINGFNLENIDDATNNFDNFNLHSKEVINTRLETFINKIKNCPEILDFKISTRHNGLTIEKLILDDENNIHRQIDEQNKINIRYSDQNEEEENSYNNNSIIDNSLELSEQNTRASCYEKAENKSLSENIANIRVMVKRKFLNFTQNRLNFSLNCNNLQNQKNLNFKNPDKIFIEQVGIDFNKEWNEKSLFDLYNHRFSDSCNNTKKNIELINILETSGYYSNLINFLKRTRLKDMIKEYIESDFFEKDIKKFKNKYNDEAVKKIEKTAKSYYGYYENNKGNKMKLGRRKKETI